MPINLILKTSPHYEISPKLLFLLQSKFALKVVYSAKNELKFQYYNFFHPPLWEFCFKCITDVTGKMQILQISQQILRMRWNLSAGMVKCSFNQLFKALLKISQLLSAHPVLFNGLKKWLLVMAILAAAKIMFLCASQCFEARVWF